MEELRAHTGRCHYDKEEPPRGRKIGERGQRRKVGCHCGQGTKEPTKDAEEQNEWAVRLHGV